MKVKLTKKERQAISDAIRYAYPHTHGESKVLNSILLKVDAPLPFPRELDKWRTGEVKTS